MEVFLAGYNVDTEVLKELKVDKDREDITPEVISAAYARISRDPRSIFEIRKEARLEVEKARRSNSTIIFKMGHHSVAEHAVFNLDIIGVSRYVMEEVEKFRLCSYTEKSQRYITLSSDFVLPEEIKGTRLEKYFLDTIKIQNKAYFEFFEKIKKYIFKKYKELAEDLKNHSLLEGWAKEDARYITSLATVSQVGLTINARNLELLLRRFASNELLEVQLLGKKIYEQIAQISPSIVIFHQANDYDRKTYPEIKRLTNKILKSNLLEDTSNNQDVKLLNYTQEGDKIIAASLLHTSSNLSFEKCREIVDRLRPQELESIFKASWRNMQFYDAVLREFEYAYLMFNVVLSSACFAQMKRHRMTTITFQQPDPKLGITIPDSIKEIGEEKRFNEIIDRTNDVYYLLKKKRPLVANYILTNAHRRRMLLSLNARELYHISRLREDKHAQWDIRDVVSKIVMEAKKVMPITFKLICGKDKYNEIYRSVFKKLPRVTKIELPPARKIK